MAVQMTKSQLIEKIAAETEVAKKEVKGILETLATVGYKELKKSGDVTTILEERDRFSVLRLIAVTEDSWTVEAVRFPKVDFDEWFEKARKSSQHGGSSAHKSSGGEAQE